MDCNRSEIAVAAVSSSRRLYERAFNHAGRYFNMKLSKKTTHIVVLLATCLTLSYPTVVSAKEADSPIPACLKAWRDHPFGEAPQFKSLEGSLTVFGVGRKTGDTEPTSTPSLVLIEPSFNAMGGSTIELLNPNGWYCMRTMLSIMGTLSIRAHCKARLAATSAGSTAVGNNTENRNIKDLAVTSIGTVAVERPCD
jgi:hypothetical protein